MIYTHDGHRPPSNGHNVNLFLPAPPAHITGRAVAGLLVGGLKNKYRRSLGCSFSWDAPSTCCTTRAHGSTSGAAYRRRNGHYNSTSSTSSTSHPGEGLAQKEATTSCTLRYAGAGAAVVVVLFCSSFFFLYPQQSRGVVCFGGDGDIWKVLLLSHV